MKTLEQSIGTVWRRVRIAAVIGVPVSGVLFAVNPLAGFFTLLIASATLHILSGREYVIASLRRIKTITALRERLLHFGDAEHVLEGIRDEQIWRGEEPDPEVLAALEKHRKNREELEARLMQLVQSLTAPAHEKATASN